MVLEKIQVFTAPGCEPCSDLKEAVEKELVLLKGVPEGTEIELVDLASEASDRYFRELDIQEAPVAFHAGKRCEILVDDASGQITIQCNQPDEGEISRLGSQEPAQEQAGVEV